MMPEIKCPKCGEVFIVDESGYSAIVNQIRDAEFHKDLHPATTFYDTDKFIAAIPEADREFAKDKKNWNSVANLQLLNGSMNESKKDSPLAEWVSKNNIDKKSLFVNDTTSLDIKDFKAFIVARKAILNEYLNKLVNSNNIFQSYCVFFINMFNIKL